MKAGDASNAKSTKNSTVVIASEHQETSNQNSLTVNKRFVVNTLKQVDDHNRIKTNQNSKLLRKFQNEERKKHTLKNLKKFSAQKTLYSDFFEVSLGCKKTKGNARGRAKIITPLEQVKRLILEAPSDFRLGQNGHQQPPENMLRVVRKSRFSIDKTLLKNHMRHHSVHNRLREEKEMWEKHQSTTNEVIGLQSRSSRRSNKYGGMYADREPGNYKITKVKETPDEPRSLGPATRALLDFEDSMPERWGHRGFKETYDDDSEEITAQDNWKGNSSRKIVISSISDRLNSSIELSDDEVEILPSSKTRKLGSRIVVSNLSGDEPNGANEVISKKKSIVNVAHKTNRMQIEKDDGLYQNKSLRKKVNKTFTKKRKLGTLQADLILEEESNRKMLKRVNSSKWGHDGYEAINVDNVQVRKERDTDKLTNRCTTDGVRDRVAPIDKPRKNVALKLTKNNNSLHIRSPSAKNIPRMSIHSSDSDEWTEKEVDDSLRKEDVRRKLKQKNDDLGVKVTVKNRTHPENEKSIKRRLSVTQQPKKNLREKSNSDKRKIGIRMDEKQCGENDSSFTDSSCDERYEKEIGNKRQHIMRKRKFYNDR